MVFKAYDAWRKHPNVYGMWRNPFPGLKYAVAIYGAYLAFRFISNNLIRLACSLCFCITSVW